MAIETRTAEIFRKHGVRPEKPVPVSAAIEMIENPESWLPPAAVMTLWSAWLSILDRQEALSVAAKTLGPEQFGAVWAAGALRERYAELEQRAEGRDVTGQVFPGLRHRDDFEAVLVQRVAAEGFVALEQPLADAALMAFVQGDPEQLENLDMLATRLQRLRDLSAHYRVLAEWHGGSLQPFHWEPRAVEYAAVMETAGMLGEAIAATEFILDARKREEGEINVQTALRKAAAAADARKAAKQEQLDAARRLAEAEAEELDAGMMLNRARAMQAMRA